MKPRFTFLLFFMSIIASCSMKNSKYIGTYEIDTSLSKLDKFDNIDSIRNLKLYVRKDKTFEFSMDPPFIYKRSGTWELRKAPLGDVSVSPKCLFIYGKNDREDVLLPYDENYDRVYFNSPMAKGSYENQVKFLCFRRVE